MSHVHSQSSDAKPATITEIIADAVSVLIASPALILIPVILDLYYWIGWRMTLEPLASRFETWIGSKDAAGGNRIERVAEAVGSVDLLAAMSLLIPSYLSGANRDEMYFPVERDQFGIESVPIAIITIAVTMALSAVLYALFGQWLADTGLGRQRTWRIRVERCPLLVLRILGLVALLIGLLALLFFPVLSVWAVSLAVGIDLQALFIPILLFVGIGTIALFYFAPEALFVVDAKPVEAMRLSARVVRQNAWQAVGFAAASAVISIGLAEVWDLVAINAPGMLIAFIANAFVGCALALAAMLFLRDRLDRAEMESSRA